MAEQENRTGQIEIEAGAENHRIFLIRHGETDWNRNFRYQGCSDIELNATGLEQARRLAVRFAGMRMTRVWASPLSRAYRTAEIMMAHNEHPCPIERREELREISFGIWEGMSVDEVAERDPATLAQWRIEPFSKAPEGGESLAEICARSERAARQLVDDGRGGERTLVVAHGAILRSLLSALMDVENMNIMWRMRFDNCSVTVLDIWGRRPSLLLLNDTHHLRMQSDEEIAELSFPA